MEQIKVKKAVTHETWHRIEVQILRDEYGVSTIDEISKKIPVIPSAEYIRRQNHWGL